MDRHARRSLAAWLVNLGWDACVLSLGAAPAVFTSAAASALLGEFAVYYGFGYVLLSIFIAGGVVGNLRGIEDKHDTHALIALAIGGALLGTLIYVGTSHLPVAPK